MMEWTASQARQAVNQAFYNRNKELINRCLDIIKTESLAGKNFALLPISTAYNITNPWLRSNYNSPWSDDEKFVINYLTNLGYKTEFHFEKNPNKVYIKVLY